MKKKIINVSLALLLVLSVCLSVSVSASAKSDKAPKDNKPVAWVNFTGTGSGIPRSDVDGNPGGNPGHYYLGPANYGLPQGQFLVKLLSDYSVEGQLRLRFLGFDKDNPYREWIWKPISANFYTEDNGALVVDILTVATKPEIFFGSYWLIHIEDNGEPGALNDAFEISVFTSPTTLEPVFEWQVIAPDNIQVHITDAY